MVKSQQYNMNEKNRAARGGSVLFIQITTYRPVRKAATWGMEVRAASRMGPEKMKKTITAAVAMPSALSSAVAGFCSRTTPGSSKDMYQMIRREENAAMALLSTPITASHVRLALTAATNT